MMKTILFVSALFCVFASKASIPDHQIKITLDFESPQIIVGLLGGKHVTDAQLKQAAEAFGSKQLIVKVNGYSGAGEDVFKNTLKELIETGNIKGNDIYNWKLVKANLLAIKSLINKIALNEKPFVADVTQIIETYTPPNISADVKACFLVGGGSLGFVNGGDNTFNVALQTIGNDYDGLKYLMAHELYHSIQDAGQSMRKQSKEKNIPYFVQASYALAYNAWNEGTANLVGDFTKLKTAGPFTTLQLKQFSKNTKRKRQNFYLLEVLLYKAYTDTASHNYDQLYNIAFTTGYDEAGYFVGYEIAKKIEKYEGAISIGRILTDDPLVSFEKYIKLYKAHPEDETFIRFEASTEEIISKLAVWKDKI
jgi:hypothetical protein